MMVSIIIVNYNTKKLLCDCIESIYEKCTSGNYEIIVVDNCSEDDSIVTINDKYPYVKTIVNNENYGFGKANNIGVSYAKGNFILLLNSDTIVKNNIVDIFLEFYEKNSNKYKIGCLGSWLYDFNNKITNSDGFFPTQKTIIYDYLKIIFKKSKRLKIEEIHEKFDIKEVDYLTGALMFIRKDIFNKFKGFDERFFMYYEETDLQFRMKEKGYKRIIINEPKVVHLEGKSPTQSNKKRIIYTKSMYLYFKKRNSKFKFLIFKYSTLVLRIATFMKKDYSFSENIEFYKEMIKI